MNVLDLFSGIGGFSLGLERVGMRTVAFCEIDPYCQAVLRKHWPDVPIFTDVRNVHINAVAHAIHTERQWRFADNCGVDVICGGFPCQDISVAGKGAGIEGARSGLWSEFARIIGEVRPRYVIVENVAALLGRGIERVLGDLATLGFDAEWHCIPASAVGAPHRRDRVWIVAFPTGKGWRSERTAIAREANGGRSFSEPSGTGNVADAARHVRGEQEAGGTERERIGQRSQSGDVADTSGERLPQRHVNGEFASSPKRIFQGSELERAFATLGREQWQSEPDLGRVANGVPFRVDRLRAIGNAIVPQIAEIIGKAIMAHGT